MAEHSSTPEHDTAPKSGIDRRSALKKVAVGGAVAWSAPALLSSTASAVDEGYCTPKCYPSPDVSFDANSTLYCPDNGQKWVEVSFTIGGSTCPCGNEGRTLELLLVTVVSGNAEFKLSTFDPATGSGTLVFGGRGNGALSNGTYTAGAIFRTTCIDRDGTPIALSCRQTFSFGFSPSSGPCSAGENVGSVTEGTLTCDPAVCG